MGMFPDIDLAPNEFTNTIMENLAVWDSVYMLEAEKPIGFVLGRYMGPIMMLVEMNWFPWASVRNRYETVINLINELRTEKVVMGFSDAEHKHFWVHICKHGILRRVGSVNDIYAEPAAMFQSIRRK